MKKLCVNLVRIIPALWGGAALLSLSLTLPACGPESPPETPAEARSSQDEVAIEAKEETEEETVEPRYGGVLAELGEDEAYVEFVLDPEAGWVSVYILDGSARDRVRLTADQVGVIFTMHGDDIPADERTFSRALQPVESALRGETPGDTAHFEARHELFQNAEGFDAVIPAIKVKDTEYTNVSVQYRADRD